MKHLFLVCAFALLTTGCPDPSMKALSTPTPAQSPTPALTPLNLSGEITDEPHSVICGCLVKGIDHCGEYMVLEGHHVEITDHGLGDMPFCGKGSELKATLSGTYVEGKLKATKVELVK
tara:strand:- start:154 stop:510 length:357 start_codon:yes stop_codon:yes gene_type:complete